jgi:hypothetical protein
MNKLVPGTIVTYNEEGKIKSPLQEVENVQIYLKGCWKIGVADSFTISDLRKVTGVGLVLNNICSLMRTAGIWTWAFLFGCCFFEGKVQVSLGWNGPTLGPVPTKENTTKKWNPVETAPRFSHADEVEGLSEFERAYSRMQMELVELQQEKSRLLAQKLNLVEELRGLKETHKEERAKMEQKKADMDAKAEGKNNMLVSCLRNRLCLGKKKGKKLFDKKKKQLLEAKKSPEWLRLGNWDQARICGRRRRQKRSERRKCWSKLDFDENKRKKKRTDWHRELQTWRRKRPR